MKRINSVIAFGLICVMLGTASMVVLAEEEGATIDSETDVAELQEIIKRLNDENRELRAQLEALQGGGSGETEGEAADLPSEVVGTVYTDAAIVRTVQQALNDAGFDCGAPDGKAGPRTAEAINAFETANGINVNGVITDELIDKLGIADAIAEAARQEAMKNEYSRDYSYTQIARSPDSFTGQKIAVRGRVLQEGSAGYSKHYIRLASNMYYDDVFYVEYDPEIVDLNILEDDIITVYGECTGDYTYTALLGQSITLPSIEADMIDMSEVSPS